MQHFIVHLDYETSERCGAGGHFQIISIEDENDRDLTHKFDQGFHYQSLEDLSRAISETLGIPEAEVSVEEV